jgi:hypothetical protein
MSGQGGEPAQRDRAYGEGEMADPARLAALVPPWGG